MSARAAGIEIIRFLVNKAPEDRRVTVDELVEELDFERDDIIEALELLDKSHLLFFDGNLAIADRFIIIIIAYDVNTRDYSGMNFMIELEIQAVISSNREDDVIDIVDSLADKWFFIKFMNISKPEGAIDYATPRISTLLSDNIYYYAYKWSWYNQRNNRGESDRGAMSKWEDIPTGSTWKPRGVLEL